ncbi:hypothetical protein PVAND_007247 [Polypedilum vanderplanki]|uniref:Uncharacterized protein n=1 Tax=Polypedilum vanderplanki TaxID=319348 RepID=A0A9J6C633_POLVA|nr:hypothetical protein PVAND_007247 [Polypedilum vanderplanki]
MERIQEEQDFRVQIIRRVGNNTNNSMFHRLTSRLIRNRIRQRIIMCKKHRKYEKRSPENYKIKTRRPKKVQKKFV